MNSISSFENDTIEPTYQPLSGTNRGFPTRLFNHSGSGTPVMEKFQRGSFESISDTMSDQSLIHSTPKNASLELIPDSHSEPKRKQERSMEMTPPSNNNSLTPSREDGVIVSETPESVASPNNSELSPCPNRLICQDTIAPSPANLSKNEIASLEWDVSRETGISNRIKLKGTKQAIINPSMSPSQIVTNTCMKKFIFNGDQTTVTQKKPTPSRLLRKLYRKSGGRELFRSELKHRFNIHTLKGKKAGNTRNPSKLNESDIDQQVTFNPPKATQPIFSSENISEKAVEQVNTKQEFQEPHLSNKPWIDSTNLKEDNQSTLQLEESNSKEAEEQMEYQVELQYTISQDPDTSISELAEEHSTSREQDTNRTPLKNILVGSDNPSIDFESKSSQQNDNSQRSQVNDRKLASQITIEIQPDASPLHGSDKDKTDSNNQPILELVRNQTDHREPSINRKSPNTTTSTLKLTEIPIPILPNPPQKFKGKLPNSLGNSASDLGKECSIQDFSFESSSISSADHIIDFVAPSSVLVDHEMEKNEMGSVHASALVESTMSTPASHLNNSNKDAPNVPSGEFTESSFENDTSSASWLDTKDYPKESSGRQSVNSLPPKSSQSSKNASRELGVVYVKAPSSNPSVEIVCSSQGGKGSPLVSKVQDSEQSEFKKPLSPLKSHQMTSISSTPNNNCEILGKDIVPDSCEDINHESIKMLLPVDRQIGKTSSKRSRENEENTNRPCKKGKSEDTKRRLVKMDLNTSITLQEDRCLKATVHEALYSSCPSNSKRSTKRMALITPSPTQVPITDIKTKYKSVCDDSLVTPPSSTTSSITQPNDGSNEKAIPSKRTTRHTQLCHQCKGPCTNGSQTLCDSCETVNSIPRIKSAKTESKKGNRKDKEPLIKSSSSPEGRTGSYPVSYQVDNRVWAKWDGDSHFYSATIVAEADTSKYMVKFDDGDEGICEIACLRPLVLLKDTSIFAVRTKRHMFEAKVISSATELVEEYEVEFVDQSHEKRLIQTKDIIMNDHMLTLLDQNVIHWERFHSFMNNHAVEKESGSVDSEVTENGIFKGLGFLITNIRTNNSEERKCGGDEAIEGRFMDDFDRNKIVSIIKHHEGIVISDFSDIYNGRERIPFKSASDIKDIFVIASSSKRTKKYLMALALGIPRVSSVWVAECARQKQLLNYQSYQLCNGWSRELNAFASSVPTGHSDGLFKQLTLYINGSNTFRSDWESTLEAGGATILSKKCLTNHSVNLAKPILCDYVINEKAPSSKFLETVRRRLRCQNYSNITASGTRTQTRTTSITISNEVDQDIYPKLISAEWAVQCLINQRLTDWNRHEAYTKWEKEK
ncbi:hypothetical protein K7432_001282 [Basidiobolus ranarum]